MSPSISISEVASLEDFKESLREVLLLMNLQERQNIVERSLSSNEYSRDVSNALCRASLLMLVAHFEGFLKSLLSYFIDVVVTVRPPVRNLPDSLLELMCSPFIENVVSAPAGNRAQVLRKSLPHFARMWDPDITASGRFIKEELLVRSLTSARPVSIDQAFRNIGISSVMADVSAAISNSEALTEGGTVRLDLAGELAALVDRRNQIAHGDKSIKPTASEVQRATVLLAECSVAMHSSVVSHTSGVCTLGRTETS